MLPITIIDEDESDDEYQKNKFDKGYVWAQLLDTIFVPLWREDVLSMKVDWYATPSPQQDGTTSNFFNDDTSSEKRVARKKPYIVMVT